MRFRLRRVNEIGKQNQLDPDSLKSRDFFLESPKNFRTTLNILIQKAVPFIIFINQQNNRLTKLK